MKRLIYLLTFIFCAIGATFGQKTVVEECVLCSEPIEPHGSMGVLSSILGKENLASGYSAIAGGAFTRANKVYSIAFGTSVISDEDQCISLGSNILNQSSSGIAIGKYLVNTGYESLIIGMGYALEEPLINPIVHSIMFGMYSTEPTMIITEPLRPTGEHFLTGRVGIGNVIQPEGKLHIKADQGENADIFLQTNEIGSHDTVRIYFGNRSARIESKLDQDLTFFSNHNYLFPSGFVGIGTLTPSSLLDVNGQIHSISLEADDISANHLISSNIDAGILETDNLSVIQNDNSWAATIENLNAEGKGLLVKAGTYTFTNPILEVQDKDGNSILYTMANQGKIGIGTTNPQSKLDVAGTVKSTGFQLTTNPVEGYVLTSNSTGNAAWIDPTLAYYWQTNIFDDIYRMSRVGINLQNPYYDLDVQGNLGVRDYITGKSSGIFNEFQIFASELANSPVIEMGRGDYKKDIQLITRDVEGKVEMIINNQLAFSLSSSCAFFGAPDFLLDMKVNGKINAKEVQVTLDGWQDKVFESDYPLMDINTLEKFIKEYKHLPEVPTEQIVLREGINVGEMNALLVRKIEELTLYIIDLKKDNEEIKRKLKTLEGDVK